MSIEMMVFESYEELTGNKVDLNGLRDLIRKYSRDSILFLCAAASSGTQLWDGAHKHQEDYFLFLKRFYAEPLLSRLLFGYWKAAPRRMLLHRLPILLLCKLALRYCSPIGVDIAREPQCFGLLLLIANDQFHHSVISDLSMVSTTADFARIITEFCSVSEYGEEDIARNLVRSHLMLGQLTQELNESSQFVDALAEYEVETGISKKEFPSLIFGVQAYLMSLSFAGIITEPGGLPLREMRFKETAIPYETVKKFLDHMSGNKEDLKASLESRDFGANDFTALRMAPMVGMWFNVGFINQWHGFLVLDSIFLADKVLTGPYWAATTRHGEKFRRFWGEVFERYVNQLLAAPAAKPEWTSFQTFVQSTGRNSAMALSLKRTG